MTATLITGAPGTGKTARLIGAAADFIAAGSDPARLLILAPTRTGATRIRDGLARRTDASMSTAPTRAWAAYAFDLLRRAHSRGRLDGVEFSPKLLSGPEQDVMIG
ncbi:MAG: AAA family ATPase, partial [Rothia sp. (in: high G+C Gram-positive bacteria)]|uniref:AAA family ATPase n=1 Tax=Rothia sp. (in: high G+C Gram-positive bacteria) TaxID=1885016 RepID=UPI0026E0856B